MKMKTCIPLLAIWLIIFSGSNLFAQTSEKQLRKRNCKVMVENLTGEFWGECKNGLAQGSGKAKGVDVYEGSFKKGLPDGFGTYTWADGSYYAGDWKKGKRQGKGRLFKATDDEMVKKEKPMGMWKNDQFLYEIIEGKYEVVFKRDIESVQAKLLNQNKDYVTIVINKSNRPVNIDAVPSNGEVRVSENFVYLNQITFPLSINLNYNYITGLGQLLRKCELNLELETPGNWQIDVK
jgi:hypothetical protein